MSQNGGRAAGERDQFGGPLHVMADQIEHLLTLLPQRVRAESAGDVGVLAMTMGRLRLFTIDEVAVTAEQRMVGHLCMIVDASVDALHRCAEDEGWLIQGFVQLRTQIKALDPVVDDLITALSTLSGKLVNRLDLAADARAAASSSEKSARSRAAEHGFVLDHRATRLGRIAMAGNVSELSSSPPSQRSHVLLVI